MIDHLLGRPSVSWKRTQVFLVIFFWVSRLVLGSREGPRLLWIRNVNRTLGRYSPWQVILSTLTCVYAFRHVDSIFGIGSPEPLAKLYSRSYYRATWITTGLDAGFATAMSIQPKWLRDICSIIFSAYYIFYANEADEKLRKFRAVCTVELLRTTWEKTTNPYLRALTYFDRPRLPVTRKILLPRPCDSLHKKPICAWLYFAQPEWELASCTDLILDFPGGGFICMSPRHHEERLRRWAVVTGRPVLSIDYGKAPEYPYPWAIEEGFDVYRVLAESKGRAIGMAGTDFNVILTGDSAGANLVATIMFKILEHPKSIPHPSALVFNYAALDFNFSSWMRDDNMRILQNEQSSSNIAGLVEQKDHFAHKSPLSVVKDVGERRLRKRKSWGKALGFKSRQASPESGRNPTEDGHVADEESDDDYYPVEEQDKPIAQRVVYSGPDVAEAVRLQQAELSEVVEVAKSKAASAKKAPIGTRLTMTSRTGFFQDRIISPSMMRAMAILYIGPRRNPDFETDYYISPLLAPARLLVEFPPLLMTCGEKDPFVDDTVIFAGRVRQAKRARKAELEQKAGGKSAKFGEGLRMTSTVVEEEKLLKEQEEDWVQMEIFEGWSHGYLQMPTLLHEARAAIDNIARWMDQAFTTHGVRRVTKGKRRGAVVSTTGSETEGEEVLTLVPKRKRTPPTSLSENRGPATPPISPKQNAKSVEVPVMDNRRMQSESTKGKGKLDEAELMRRRRVEAVEGMGEIAEAEEILIVPRIPGGDTLKEMESRSPPQRGWSTPEPSTESNAYFGRGRLMNDDSGAGEPEFLPPRHNSMPNPVLHYPPPPFPPPSRLSPSDQYSQIPMNPHHQHYYAASQYAAASPGYIAATSNTPSPPLLPLPHTAASSAAAVSSAASSSSSASFRLPPILQVEKQHVTTTATQAASASRRRNDALFKCPVPGCGSTFTRRFNLRGHLRSHTEERPFVCEWPGCGKGFARSHDCKRHQALHSAKVGTHACSGCGKTFSRMDALNRHLRSEGGAGCRTSLDGATDATMDPSEDSGASS